LDHGNRYSATTDSEGRFRIEGIEDGAYRPRYSASGFSPIPYPGGVLPPFTVARAGEPVRLEVKMQPLGKLSGRVKDASGNPVPYASVWLVRGDKWWMPPPACLFHDSLGLNSDANGQYRVPNLAPGPWLLSASAPPSWNPPDPSGDERLGWAQTFYPGATDPQLAAPVIVGTAGEQWSPDIKIAAVPVRRVHGTILDVRGDPVATASVVLGRGFGPGLTQIANDDGTFEFDTVPDGEWRLSAGAEKDGVKLRATQSVQIKSLDVENLVVRLAAPFLLRGRVVMEVPEGTPAPAHPEFALELVSSTALPSDGLAASNHIFTDGDSLTVKNVYPGSYEIEPLSGASLGPYYLDSIRLGDSDAVGSVSIPSDAQPLTITYKLGGGSVRGTVEGCTAGHVFLVPQDLALRHPGFLQISECDDTGRFEFAAVRPGDYYGFAVAGDPFPAGSIIRDSELLKRTSSVTVRASESTSAEIQLIAR
jgi:protocatechuate 3,4-dioxygenase beta subunit